MSIALESIGSSSSSRTPGSCPVCAARGAFSSPFSAEPYHLYECASCGLVFLHPRPTAKELSNLYTESYYGKGRKKFAGMLESAIASMTLLKWKRLRVLLGPGDRMLDVGCGRGTLVKLARAAGFEAYGLERHYPEAPFSPHIFYHDLAESAFPDGHFQIVVLWHVLEHLPDPAESLREIYRLLKPGGCFSVAVPNFGGAQARASGAQWFHLDLPRHFWHFDADALEGLLERTGFSVERRATLSLEYDWFGTLQSWLNRSTRDNNRFYSLLKGTLDAPATVKFQQFSLAAVLTLPALASALSDAARGQGGTLTLLARKPRVGTLPASR